MKISSQIIWEFDKLSVSGGYQIFRKHGVRLIKEDSKVLGLAGGQQVTLSFRGSGLVAGCDCQRFHKALECSHVYGAILEAENRELLEVPEGPVTFVPTPLSRQRIVSMEMLENGSAGKPKQAPPRNAWQGRIYALRSSSVSSPADKLTWPANRVVLYSVDVVTGMDRELQVHAHYSDPRKSGNGFNKPRPLALNRREIEQLPDAQDREILIALCGARDATTLYRLETPPSSWRIGMALARVLTPQLCRTGRCFLDVDTADETAPLLWEDEPWHFTLDVAKSSSRISVLGVYVRGEERMPIDAPSLVVGGALLFTPTTVAPIEGGAPQEWIENFRNHGPIAASPDEWDDLAGTLIELPLPKYGLPEDLQAVEEQGVPVPCLRIEGRKTTYHGPKEDVGVLSYDYGEESARDGDPRRGFLQPDRRLLLRDLNLERVAKQRLEEFRLPPAPHDPNQPPGWLIPAPKLARLVSGLSREGWRIDLRGKQLVQASDTVLDVSSSIDWFDVNASVSFGDHSYSYPELLKALDSGGMLVLPNGDIGVAPDEWLAEMGRLSALGKTHGNSIRFGTNQTALLDVLLADRADARCDAAFAAARSRLKAFDGVRSAEQPPTFQGQLRDYQRDGLGWMSFLREFGFGGCLADDMGVGKTAQVLAMLECRRLQRASGESLPPSLVVVPRSLVFNWQQEVTRFTPQLKVLDHTLPDRNLTQIGDHDIVIVTYGTLRRDIVELREIEFDYAILDEAQAIKNAASDSAKSVRLINAKHRLVLSGTPVQNSLTDLWSIFQFLNPGMLGTAGAFKNASGLNRDPDERTRAVLAKALRPLILRRTKEQVASELPPKVESILHCELEGDQKKLYNELRDHYRRALLGEVDRKGMGKSKMQVLEALLRLRQAACHPGLIDKTKTGLPSAKLDTLLERLEEVIAEGHKALVFSQFTSFLDIVRNRLDANKVKYEYLDGGTTDRQARVENFENSPDLRIFLISLKAGGVGLNLTSADYVFLLDPWWNPAVEAQAIDRTHRIGQTRHVFAYRLIAKDTVEEKVLALQDSKRKLAEAVINQENSLLQRMGREELEFLLS